MLDLLICATWNRVGHHSREAHGVQMPQASQTDRLAKGARLQLAQRPHRDDLDHPGHSVVLDPVREVTVVDCCVRHDHESMFPSRDALGSRPFVEEYCSSWRSVYPHVCCHTLVLKVRSVVFQEMDELDRSERQLQAREVLYWGTPDQLLARFDFEFALLAQGERRKQVNR